MAMGLPLGPVLAKIFLGYCEFLILENRWPELCQRFVDDTFSLFAGGRGQALCFLELLNSLHLSLTFTMENDFDNRLPFLDVLVLRKDERFSITVYQKPMATGLYTRRDSYCAPGQKIGLIRSLALHGKRICSAEYLDDKITQLLSIFEKNDYRSTLVNT